LAVTKTALLLALREALPMNYLLTRPTIVAATVLASVGYQATSCGAQDQRPCLAPQSIETFCAHLSTISYIVKIPQVARWLRTHSTTKDITDQARITISCDHFSDNQPVTMVLYQEVVGTIGLAYSAEVGSKGRIFSAVPLDPAGRRSTSGTTPGTFAIINMCQLQNDQINGLLFNGNLPLPLWFHGKEEKRSRIGWSADVTVAPSNQTEIASDTESDATSIAAVPREFDRLKFSGIYGFDAEDEVCLADKKLMLPYHERSAPERLGVLTPGQERQLSAKQVKSWERRCPRLKGSLVVVAWDDGVPIYNFDHGTHVSHYLVGTLPVMVSKSGGLYTFQSTTPNGDTTGPNTGMSKIDGKFDSKNESIDFFVFRPNSGKMGRLRPVDQPSGRSRSWATYAPFHATKRLDIYCKIGLRSERDCNGRNKNWDAYLHEIAKQRDKLIGLSDLLPVRP
jgi:hypothetical protein